MAERIDGGRFDAPPGTYVDAVRGIPLKRRRSRVPWIYLVYHACRRAPRHRRSMPKGGWTTADASVRPPNVPTR